MKRIKSITLSVSTRRLQSVALYVSSHMFAFLALILSVISVVYWLHFYGNGIGLAYNDARSHLDIARRVVEGLKPGIAQIGSVWLPLPHLLMVPLIWNDFLWHSGLAGAIFSMASFVCTGLLVYAYLRELGSSMMARLFGVFLFAANVNILYLQSTPMTELLLLATMTAGSYFILTWAKTQDVLLLIKASFFIMLSTLIRYEGWFLIMQSTLVVAFLTFRTKGYKAMEGITLLFVTLGGFGILLWLLWNALIFKDPLYFAFGPFSAHMQQSQLLEAGNLPTKGNLLFSIRIYLLALFYNSYTIPAFIAFTGFLTYILRRINKFDVKIATVALLAPIIFNILALYLGHSVLFIQGVSGNTWFNVRYGIMMAPTIAIFSAVLIDSVRKLRWSIIGISIFVLFFAFANGDAVTIDDARVGSSQKNVSQVSSWLRENTAHEDGFILISAASHDAIIFSSGLPMKRFIHEGTGAYWESATASPDRWARWIVMRTHDTNDLTFRFVNESGALEKYTLVDSYPFADIYQLKDEYLSTLQTQPIFHNQK